MIRSLKVLEGFATKLPAIGKKTFEFQKGINILFGPNACGKTTIINLVGAYSGTKAGWSKFIDPFYAKEEYPGVFKTLAPGDCRAEAEWDGSPTFLMSPKTGDPLGSTLDESQDGLMSMDMIVGEMMFKASSGQSRIMRLNKLADVLKAVPDLKKRPGNYESVNSSWQAAMDKFVSYVKKLPRDGPATLLLDEVDQSVSIPVQKAFWLQGVPNLAKKFQLIIATHCPFALAHRDSGGLVEMESGYVDASMSAIKALVNA